jgi:Carboxypeptidase regulatory-like domain
MVKRLFNLSTILLLVALPSVPQIEVRSVTGVVTDRNGNAVQGAVVQLENTASLLVVSYLTGNDGRYRFAGLYADLDYTLTAKYQCYWSKRKTLSKFDSSKQREVDLVIPIRQHPEQSGSRCSQLRERIL